MSYILDALRKADAQRERDSSRGIHAHPTPLGAAGANAGPRAPWVWGALAIGVIVVASVIWLHDEKSAAPVPTVVATATPTATPTPSPAPVVRTPTPEVATSVIPPPPPPRLEPAHEAPIVQAPVVPQKPAPAAASPATTSLPPDAPRFAISGGVYSSNPAQRMLIVNGQVFSEGSEIAPGVTVEEIKARTAQLKFRGARYTVPY